jgi:hypothetical protein
MRTFFTIGISFLVVPQIFAADTELRNLDIQGWSCLEQRAGAAKTQDEIERNEMKNRSVADLTQAKVESLDVASFSKKVAEYDAQLKVQSRKELSPAGKQLLANIESQLVSVQGWLNLAYSGLAESTNCNSSYFHDWHLEIYGALSEHPPSIGQQTAIICEITPRTEQEIYRDNVRLKTLAGFIRNAGICEPTNHPSQLVKVTGYLMWDDAHNNSADVGPTVQYLSPDGLNHPWRSTAWEIHPVMKVEVIGQH